MARCMTSNGGENAQTQGRNMLPHRLASWNSTLLVPLVAATSWHNLYASFVMVIFLIRDWTILDLAFGM